MMAAGRPLQPAVDRAWRKGPKIAPVTSDQGSLGAQPPQRPPGPGVQESGVHRGGLGDRRELGVRGGLGVVDGHGGAA